MFAFTRRPAAPDGPCRSSRVSASPYAAPSEAATRGRSAEFAAEWDERYPASMQPWCDSWADFVPFLEYDAWIRRMICTTNTIESIDARYRYAISARGHLPNESDARPVRAAASRVHPQGLSR